MLSISTDYICLDSLEVCSNIVLSVIRNFDFFNQKTTRPIWKICMLLVLKIYFYNVSPQRSTLLLLIISVDVSTNPGLLKAN